MKVLTFTTVFPSPAQPLHGLFVAERIRHASAHAEIRIISPVPWFRRRVQPAPPTDGTVEYPRFYYVPGFFKFLDGLLLFLSALPSVCRLRRHFDFDLIDAHFGYPDGVAAILLGRWCRRPVTVTLRGSELDISQFTLRRLALAWSLRRADRVIAVSPELEALARSLGAPPERISVIGNGVDVRRFRPMDRREVRQRLGIAAAAPLLVAVGHLARVKGFELVVRTLPALAASHPEVHLAIVGGAAASSGTYPAELAAEISRLRLDERVTVTGPVSPERVAEWMNAADVFVLASEREGSPNALREALACGCPAVVSDVGDAKQLLGAHSGLVVSNRSDLEDWHAALDSALRNPWDRAAIRADAETYAWAGVAARVASEWHACVDDARALVAG